MRNDVELLRAGRDGGSGLVHHLRARGIPGPRSTLEQLLPPERRGELIDAPYYACATPECDIVYFGDAPLHYFAPEDLTAHPGRNKVGKPGPDDSIGDKEG